MIVFNKILFCLLLLFCITIHAQELKIVQDNDDILFFNESKQTVEVFLQMEDVTIDEVISPGVMKKYINDKFLHRGQLTSSQIYSAYTYMALAQDIRVSLDKFFKELNDRRSISSKGYNRIEKPFYRTAKFQDFLETKSQLEIWGNLQSKDLNKYVSNHFAPEHRRLMQHIRDVSDKDREYVVQSIHKFIATTVENENEMELFITEMNQILTMFHHYDAAANQLTQHGTLSDNGFKFFERKGNPGTNVGVYITTNNLKLLKNYNYREMETRGLNFEVELSQRLYVARVAKRRTLNLYGAASYLSIKDKEFDLKKSFINIGPQIRYAGFYENQLEIVGEAGTTIDITADKYMNPDDTQQVGFYTGGQVSLLFFRFGMRYYTQLTEPELSPEGQWFYRLGIVAKF